MSQLVLAKLLTLKAPSHPAGRPGSRPTVTGTERPGGHKPTARPTH
ncbi:hypothetical protein [Micromonospora chersina]